MDPANKMKELMNNYTIFEMKMNILLYWYRNNKFVYQVISEEFYMVYLRVLYIVGNIFFCYNNIGFIGNVFLGYTVTSDKINVDTEEVDTEIHWRNEWGQFSIVEGIAIFQMIVGILCMFSFIFRYNISLKEATIRYRLKYPYSNTNNIFIKWRLRIWDAFLNVPVIFSATLHVICSALGIFYYPVFFTLQLVNVIWINKTCNHVIQSITKNWYQLMWTIILCMFFIYIFTSQIVVDFSHDFSNDFENFKCDEQMTCFADIVDNGFRLGGGIGDTMNIQPHSNKMYWHFTTIKLAFFFVINVMFLNIIFGVIIDTFAALRQEHKDRMTDQLHVCYVCGFGRTDFSAESKDFDVHLEKQHDPWHYVNFLYYVVKIGDLNLNGLEQYAFDNYSACKTDWLPIQNTSYLTRQDDTILLTIMDTVDQNNAWLKKYDKELTKSNKERTLIGMRKKEQHKKIIPKINDLLSQGIINIKKEKSNKNILQVKESVIETSKKPTIFGKSDSSDIKASFESKEPLKLGLDTKIKSNVIESPMKPALKKNTFIDTPITTEK